MDMRLKVACPLCGGDEDIPVTIEPKIIFTQGNGKKGFVTADVGAGGVEHTCGAADPPPVPIEGDERGLSKHR
jgi:hypothetical protein